ncbi:MAG: Crp/Fnr family transcriptional regulator [Lachnospiraceae bacterium]|jgi:CRP/FNR family transcriptional regulator|nr:Crp/Fnr family transcriptional regulator [Lachnospiraceae bacterium]
MQSGETLAGYFPFWEQLTDRQKEVVRRSGATATYQRNAMVHDKGDGCVGVLLVQSGQLRVYIESEDGREITLYRLYPGDTCVLSASCFMEEITFDILMNAEEDSRVITISPSVFRKLSEENVYVENFIYRQTAQRFSDVMWTMQQILFMSFDKRLAVFLEQELKKIKGDTLRMTHDQIARYTGSAREVVSRMLKYFESEGIVALSRGKIQVRDRERLGEIRG